MKNGNAHVKASRMIHPGRFAAEVGGNFAVFLIGMRINKLWKVHKWCPVALAMPRMLKELDRHHDAGLLGGKMWFGRTTIVVQYWRSVEQLLAYARNRDAKHLPAWRAFNQAVGVSGDVGIWHETYLVSPGNYETVYVNMPSFGLGKAGALHPATGDRESAEGRLKRTVHE
jgi:hypothetical protein